MIKLARASTRRTERLIETALMPGRSIASHESGWAGRRTKTMTLDMSLKNHDLYSGCETEKIAGRTNLVTPVAEAIHIIGRNIERIIAQVPADQRDECVLTGAMAIWAYLVVFHAVVHRFHRVLYDDGHTGPVLIAKHG